MILEHDIRNLRRTGGIYAACLFWWLWRVSSLTERKAYVRGFRRRATLRGRT